ncbi:kinase-like domain-containing protein [Mycena vitilis]|nr:kinase-like domain-containing protein [Mycena vitilis]
MADGGLGVEEPLWDFAASLHLRTHFPTSLKLGATAIEDASAEDASFGLDVNLSDRDREALTFFSPGWGMHQGASLDGRQHQFHRHQYPQSPYPQSPYPPSQCPQPLYPQHQYPQHQHPAWEQPSVLTNNGISYGFESHQYPQHQHPAWEQPSVLTNNGISYGFESLAYNNSVGQMHYFGSIADTVLTNESDQGSANQSPNFAPPTSNAPSIDLGAAASGPSPHSSHYFTHSTFNDVCRRLDDLLHEEKDSYLRLLACRGVVAQELLDLLQNLLDCDSDLPPSRRRRLFKALVRLSKESGLHPQCFTLQGLAQGCLVAGGSFGDVYKGWLEGQYVAVKMMRLFEESDIDTILKEFSREALIWRQFCHPNLLPFFGLCYFQQRLCLVSPWMNNGHIRAFLKTEKCGPSRHLSLILDVALGMEYLHEQGVVHGDLKGDNIFVTPSHRACIADFGFSSIITSKSSIQFSNSSKPSQGGTIRYQAPELHRGGRHDPRSDVYSFGCVAYEIIAGHSPFPKLRTDGAVINAVLQGCRPSRPESCSLPSLDRLWNLLQSSWDPEPSKRPTAAELVKRLMGPDIQATTLQSAVDWDDRFTSRFRRHFMGQWYLPPVAELERLLSDAKVIDYSDPRNREN